MPADLGHLLANAGAVRSQVLQRETLLLIQSISISDPALLLSAILPSTANYTTRSVLNGLLRTTIYFSFLRNFGTY